MAAEQGTEDTENSDCTIDGGAGKGRRKERELIFVCSKRLLALAVHKAISEPP
jgi:hypothetical protein